MSRKVGGCGKDGGKTDIKCTNHCKSLTSSHALFPPGTLYNGYTKSTSEAVGFKHTRLCVCVCVSVRVSVHVSVRVSVCVCAIPHVCQCLCASTAHVADSRITATHAASRGHTGR